MDIQVISDFTAYITQLHCVMIHKSCDHKAARVHYEIRELLRKIYDYIKTRNYVLKIAKSLFQKNTVNKTTLLLWCKSTTVYVYRCKLNRTHAILYHLIYSSCIASISS